MFKHLPVTIVLCMAVLLLCSCAQPSPYEKIENGSELWLQIGLEAYREEAIPDFDAAAFFADPDNNGYLTLYNDVYLYNPEIFTALSTQVFRFIHDTYGAEALLDTERRMEYKNAWLQSLHPSLSYRNTPEAEKLLSSMTADYNSMYEYILTLGDTVYAIPSLDGLSLSTLHSILYYNATALQNFRDMAQHTPSLRNIVDVSVPLSYVLLLDGSPSLVQADGTLYAGSQEDLLPLAIRKMLTGYDENALWMVEGLCEYYGKALDLSYLPTYERFFFLSPDAMETYLVPMAESGDAFALRLLSTGTYYHRKGGIYTQENNIFQMDSVLYTHASAQSERDTGFFLPLSTLVSGIGDGGDLSRTQAGSFLLYLLEQTSAEDVLSVVQDYASFETVFGCSYEKACAAWLTWLSEQLNV